MLENINKLLSSSTFDRVIATRFVNFPGSQYEKFLNWNKMCESPEIDLAFNKPDNLEIIDKTSYALPLDFAKSLENEGEIYICGADYDACVLAIGFQLFDVGVRPIFIKSCIGTANKKPLPIEQFEEIVIRNFGSQSLIM